MDKIGGDKMKILFMTVGTGVGKGESRVKNLAHGLFSAIKEHDPKKVIFFGSEESKKTIEELKKIYEGEDLIMPSYEIVNIKNIDDFYDCFSRIEEKIKENENNEIIIDYTSGTKTMTTSAAIAAMLYQKSLFITKGKRGENGVVIPGTEEIKRQNLFAAYDKYAMDKAKEAFNSYRFEDAMNYLNQIVALNEKEIYKKIVEAYSLWDKFNHNEAWKILKNIKYGDVFNQNKSFLGMLDSKKEKGEIEEFLIADLLNNAQRRIEEGKCDDAVARLYRCIEMIAQYRLKEKYKIDSSDVDTWRLKIELRLDDRIVEKYEKKRKNDKIRLALNEDLELLYDLKDDLGKLKGDKLLQDLLSKRNSSILAHGITPIGKEIAYKFYDKVLEIAKKVIEGLEGKMEMAKFPKL